MKRHSRLLGFTAWCVLGLAALRGAAGDDIAAVFARAERGEPLRYVAIGGSITQASGDGWAGDWLRARFPASRVTVVNSGMSATGGALGVFRVQRDVIAHQPDLVAIEFCVNDDGLGDEDAIRYLETLVVRLKSLPRPPAILVVEAAARGGVNLRRHRRVARHYDLLEVDFQAAVDARLRATGERWETLFLDDVHPNETGHGFYREAFGVVLQPFVDRARLGHAPQSAQTALPGPLSAKPLLLDARMIPLQGVHAPGWNGAPPPPAWWGRFFQGALIAEAPGATLTLALRGATFGILHAMGKDQGSFLANVDGETPAKVIADTRGGYSSHLLATDLPAREHVVTVVATGKEDGRPAPVTLGCLLVAGETAATREASPMGFFTGERLRSLAFVPVDASAWQCSAAFPVPGAGEKPPADGRSGLHVRFHPEPGCAGYADSNFAWRPAAGSGSLVDLRAMAGHAAAAVSYARTTLRSEKGGRALLALDVDYFALVWINGRRVLALDGAHSRPHLFEASLYPGDNTILLKTASGAGGHHFRLAIAYL